MTRCLALALACSCASDQLIQPVPGDPSAGAARECVSVPPVKWPGPWDLQVAWHSLPLDATAPAGGTQSNVYGGVLLVPERWAVAGGGDAPVAVFGTLSAPFSPFLDARYCAAPCAEWHDLGFQSGQVGILAVATRDGTALLGAGGVVDDRLLWNGDPASSTGCSAHGMELPLTPAMAGDGTIYLHGLIESCLPDAGIVAVPEADPGWGTLAPLPQGLRYVKGFEARDPFTGAVLETIGAGPVATEQTLILGNPPVIVEFAPHIIQGRTLDGTDRFLVEDDAFEMIGDPCAGDLDGLPGAEFVVPVRGLLHDLQVRAYDLDGRLLWVDMSSAVSGGDTCAAADLDGDGADEVVLVDEVSFRILDGRTGRRLFEDPAWNTVTVWDHPVVADLDGDGSSEILLGVNGPNVDPDRPYHQGLVAFTHPLGILDGHAPFWPGRYMHHTNVDANGLLLAEPAPWWEDPETDGQQRMIASGPSCPDLATSLVEVCTGGGFAARVDVKIDNIGGTPIEGAVTVQLVGGDGAIVAEARVAAPAPGSAVLARLEIPWNTAAESWTASVAFDAPGPYAGCENPRLAAAWPVSLDASATTATD